MFLLNASLAHDFFSSVEIKINALVYWSAATGKIPMSALINVEKTHGIAAITSWSRISTLDPLEIVSFRQSGCSHKCARDVSCRMTGTFEWV